MITENQRDLLRVVDKSFAIAAVLPEYLKLHPDSTLTEFGELWAWLRDNDLADSPLTSAVRLTPKGKEWLASYDG